MDLPPSLIFHLTGFSEKAAFVDQACQEALGRIQSFSVLTWGGDYSNADGFTALIPLFLAGGAGRRAIAFRIKDTDNQHADFKKSWNDLAERYLGAFFIVELDKSIDFDRFPVRKDTQPGGLAANLGGGTEFFIRGRCAAKISQTKRVIALGGGGIVGCDMLCSLQDQMRWTVFALSRGRKEQNHSLMDLSAGKPEVELIRGIDPNEDLAFCQGAPPMINPMPPWVRVYESPTTTEPARDITGQEAAAVVPQVVLQAEVLPSPPQVLTHSSLATSQFKRLYDEQAVVTFQDELFGALRGILRGYAALKGDTQDHADQLFGVLQQQAFNCRVWQSLVQCDHKEVAKIAVVTWTSASIEGLRVQFCNILNFVLRQDSGESLRHAVVFTRALTSHLVNRNRGQQNASLMWPNDSLSHRGTNIPRAELGFFEKDKPYRVPMFLATSFCEAKAFDFLHRQPRGDQVPVHFKFVIDPVRKCDHAVYLEGMSLLHDEHELLFAPYSAFTVLSVNIPEGNITWDQPVVIEIKVAPNNKSGSVPDDLPLATWH